MHIGYIRTNCLSKTKHLFDNDNLLFSKFSVWKSQQKKRRDINDYPWIATEFVGKGTYKINWDFYKHQTPWLTVLKELNRLQVNYELDDLVVNTIEIGVEDKKLTGIINKYLNEEKEPLLSENSVIFVTFNNTLISNSLNGWDAEVVEQVNLQARKFLGFKKGVLEVKHIKTKLKDRNNNLDFLVNEKPVLKQILTHLNKERWNRFPEVKALTKKNGGKPPTPGAVRTYEKKPGYSKWAFLKEEEVS